MVPLLISFLKALVFAFLVVLIIREIVTFFYSFILYVFKKKKKIKSGYFKDFWNNYKIMNFEDLFIGRFIKFK